MPTIGSLSPAVDTEEEFDQVTLRHWREEGFVVTFLPYGQGGQQYVSTLKSLDKNMSLGEHFAIVAFGDAATVCMETFRHNMPRICALVAYYPSAVTDPHRPFPVHMHVVVHLAGDEVGVTRNKEMLGIQGKRRTVTKKVSPGKGTGGLLTTLSYPSYTYLEVEPGFAEHDLEEYDKVAERLAWTRSLAAVRKGFQVEVELEKVWENHLELEFKAKDADMTMATMIERPYVNHVPTMTGGIGQDDLHRFYDEFFIPNNPPSTNVRLLSRTIGTDRVVDEMLFSFDHTQEVPWMLPDIPPTGKSVEVALVSVVCIRGGKLYHEHIYWDQASVLVQVGLLDPKAVPKSFSDKGVKRLPVVGAEGARKVVDEKSEPSNELISSW
ncbi:dienelactone hydrolase-like protein [Rhizodiscina lignyota]|uniref:Dienelactone hydrolase-like protein n=1 Tax=Rhizodiscina lignyota TaxID=1504668 RepID=A0A9P4M5I6_9PEZI|nr:dienelactone hydrolase-like protein [Rhizodiscina lignyota]